MRIQEILSGKGFVVVHAPPDSSVGDLVALLKQHNLGAVIVSPDGRHVVTTSEGGAVTVHPVDGSPGSSLQLAGANCIAWEGSTIAVGQRTGPAVLELRTP